MRTATRMSDLTAISEIIDQYSRHGWALRRALISSASIAAYGSQLASMHSDLEISESVNEALWFSRRSHPDREAWELRRLSGSPFAMVTNVENSLGDDEREELLTETFRRMFDGSHPEPTSH